MIIAGEKLRKVKGWKQQNYRKMKNVFIWHWSLNCAFEYQTTNFENFQSSHVAVIKLWQIKCKFRRKLDFMDFMVNRQQMQTNLFSIWNLLARVKLKWRLFYLQPWSSTLISFYPSENFFLVPASTKMLHDIQST